VGTIASPEIAPGREARLPDKPGVVTVLDLDAAVDLDSALWDSDGNPAVAPASGGGGGRGVPVLGPLEATAVAVRAFDVRKYEDELLLLFL